MKLLAETELGNKLYFPRSKQQEQLMPFIGPIKLSLVNFDRNYQLELRLATNIYVPGSRQQEQLMPVIVTIKIVMFISG